MSEVPGMVIRQREDEGRAVGRGTLLSMFVTAVVLRVALIAAAMWVIGVPVERYSRMRDGASYLYLAQAITGDTAAYMEKEGNQRMFPGFPAIMAVAHELGLPWNMSGLVVNVLASGVVAVLMAVFFRDERLGWAAVMLPPSYMLSSSMVMSESTLLMFIMMGLALLRWRGFGMTLLAGLALGYAGIIRPVACFAVLGCVVYLAMHKEWWRAVILAGASAAVVLVAGAWMQHFVGDPLHNIKVYSQDKGAYAGHPFGWPFESLIMTPLNMHLNWWKIPYVWMYVMLDLGACVLLIRQWLAARAKREDAGWVPLLTVWIIGNTVFTLCIGHTWGFQEFHRFVVSALPALLVAYRFLMPVDRKYWWVVVGPVFALALFGIAH